MEKIDEVVTGDPVTLNELAQSFQATGDDRYFNEIYHRCEQRTFFLCLRMVNCVTEAQDLSQECFLQLYRKIGTFRGESQFATWFHRMTINVVLMKLRKKGLKLISLDEVMDGDSQEPRPFGKRDLALVSIPERIALEGAIAKLPAGYRLVFVLHDIEGYEHNEIADMLECSIGTSKSQLHRARMRLRESLGKWRQKT